MDENVKLNFLKNQSLLKDLSEEQLHSILDKFTEITFKTNEAIVKEGDVTTDVYLLFEGCVNVLRWDEEHEGQVLLARLEKGDAFGESSFLVPTPRSSTVKTTKPTTVFKLSREEFKDPKLTHILLQICNNIAQLNTSRLNKISRLYIKKIRENEKYSQLWHKLGLILFFQCLFFSLFATSSKLLPSFMQSYYLWMSSSLTAVILIKNNLSGKYSWDHFGFNLTNVKSSVIVSLVIVLLATLLSFIVFWMLSLSDTTKILSIPLIPSAPFSWRSFFWNLMYFASYSFFQEFVGRGVLQTTLQAFLSDEKGYKSVFTHACSLFVLLLPLDTHTAFTTFLLSIPMGIIFLKQKTLIGVFLIHFLLSCLGLLA